MAIMMGKLYAALRAGEIPEDKAIAAAEEVAGFENRLADMRLVKWMLGFDLALTVAIAVKLFLH
jgi:hypothetical protein